ncbi:MAG: hypothetical protein AAGK00_00350 [Pseudomonadota bacterium]
MKRLFVILLIPIAIAAGGAAGVFLKEPPPAAEEPQAEVKTDPNQPPEGSRSFVKIGKQTIIPVVDGGETKALMLFELAIDVPVADTDRVHDLEPRIRAAFLRELLRMSYTGAFLTNFTDDRIIEELRRNLTRAARTEVGAASAEVLILDVMRQEL